MGGNSLSALRAYGMLVERTGRQLSPSIIFQYPTIEKLEQYLAIGKDAGFATELPIDGGLEVLQDSMKRLLDYE